MYLDVSDECIPNVSLDHVLDSFGIRRPVRGAAAGSAGAAADGRGGRAATIIHRCGAARELV